MTLQQQCYHTVRNNGGTASVAYVIAVLGADRERVERAMTRLYQRGWCERIDFGVYRISKHGEPTDGRGRHPACHTVAARAKAAATLASRDHARPGIALEQAWPFVGSER